MPPTAAKLWLLYLAKVLTLLRLDSNHLLQYFIEADLENSKIVYTFVV